MKFNTAALEVPEFTTVALVPGAPVVTVPTVTVAASPGLPVSPLSPLSPLLPRGIVKSNTAAPVVPELVTLALVPAAPVVVVPTLIVAASPWSPLSPLPPVAPVAPRGIVKLKTAAELVPEFVTVASLPSAPVVTVPTDMVAAAPALPVSPLSPLSPLGIVKLSTAALDVPALVTLALVPGAPVVVLPTEIVAAWPGAPVSPVSPLSPLGIPKLNTAALDVPVLVTVGVEPDGKLVAVPAAIVAAVPVSPFSPFSPRRPPVFLSLKYVLVFLAVRIGLLTTTSILLSGAVVIVNFGLTVFMLNFAIVLTP